MRKLFLSVIGLIIVDVVSLKFLESFCLLSFLFCLLFLRLIFFLLFLFCFCVILRGELNVSALLSADCYALPGGDIGAGVIIPADSLASMSIIVVTFVLT